MEHPAPRGPKTPLSDQKLRSFFITHLTRIYCAKSHLFERLPEIRLQAHFGDLTHAVAETTEDVRHQLARMDKIFSLLDQEPGFENCDGMIGLIEDAFSVINSEKDPELSDLSILFYLRQIESIEMASFSMLKLVVPAMERGEISQLLLENYDEAKEDLALFRLITTHYFAG